MTAPRFPLSQWSLISWFLVGVAAPSPAQTQSGPPPRPLSCRVGGGLSYFNATHKPYDACFCSNVVADDVLLDASDWVAVTCVQVGYYSSVDPVTFTLSIYDRAMDPELPAPLLVEQTYRDMPGGIAFVQLEFPQPISLPPEIWVGLRFDAPNDPNDPNTGAGPLWYTPPTLGYSSGRIAMDTDDDGELDQIWYSGVDLSIYLAVFSFPDCNRNLTPDAEDIASGSSVDCDGDAIPDECEPDCNANGIADACDIRDGTSPDCNRNGVPDECEEGGLEDCNANGMPDLCDIFSGASADCNGNLIPDECDLASGTSLDCNANAVPDECDIPSETSPDCNENGIPDECDIAAGTSLDCNATGVPDECELAEHLSSDCNGNGIPDECDVLSGFSADCDRNGWPDECMTVFPDVFPLEVIGGPTGFTMVGSAEGEQIGGILSGGGDINGDGFDDLIIGGGDIQSGTESRAYVVFGRRAPINGVLPLDDLPERGGFFITGFPQLSGTITNATRVSGIGDVNADGFDDVAVALTPENQFAGRIYVIYGARDIGSAEPVRLDALDGENGMRINGLALNDFAGFSIAGAGDVDGDAIGDLIIGAPGVDPNGVDRAGAAYVLFGGRFTGRRELNLENLDGQNGFRIVGIPPGGLVGYSVCGAGDVNGDGFDDLAIGAPGSHSGTAGRVYVVFGGTAVGGSGEFSLRALDETRGFRIVDRDTNTQIGGQVTGVGDLNGDGYAEIGIAAKIEYDAFVVFGGADVSASGPIDVLQLDGTDGFRATLRGAVRAVSGVGDMNADGFDDALFGSPFMPSVTEAPGWATVVFGDPAVGAAGNVREADLDGSFGFRMDGLCGIDRCGYAVSGTGDFNGDGIADALVGAPTGDHCWSYATNAGEAYLFYGRRMPLDHDGDSTPDACECPGDLDADGDVDLEDLAVLLRRFGIGEGATLQDGDLDGDGDVDLSDLAVMLVVFRGPCI